MSEKPIPPRPGRGALAARMAEILRVDHAGEMAAVAIYRGQRTVLGEAQGHERIAGQLAEMETQEAAAPGPLRPAADRAPGAADGARAGLADRRPSRWAPARR